MSTRSQAPGRGGSSWEGVEDYATLAKAGGRRDLLYHFENVRDPNQKPVEVPPSVEWFAHEDIPKRLRGSPRESIHKDHWSQWNTDVPKLPSIASQPAMESTKKKDNLKLPSIVPGKDDVDMRKLLSLEYQKEWLDKRKAKIYMEREKLNDKKAAQRKKLEEHIIKARKNLKIDQRQSRERMSRRTIENTSLKLPPL